MQSCATTFGSEEGAAGAEELLAERGFTFDSIDSDAGIANRLIEAVSDDIAQG